MERCGVTENLSVSSSFGKRQREPEARAGSGQSEAESPEKVKRRLRGVGKFREALGQ
jgi:hypothetical protein